METKSLEIKIEKLDGQELVIRHGEALPLHEPEKIELTGSISAPSEFYLKRKAQIDHMHAHLKFNYQQAKIELVIDETSVYATVIEGVLKTNPELIEFKINTQKTFNISELKQLLKLNRIHFSDMQRNLEVVASLEKFKANVSQNLQKDEVQRGNKANIFTQQVQTDLLHEFVLDMPVFVGGENRRFAVEICFDVRDAQVSFWLESIELQDILLKERKQIIDAELAKFDAALVQIQF